MLFDRETEQDKSGLIDPLSCHLKMMKIKYTYVYVNVYCMVYVNITIYLNILQRTEDIFRKLSLFSSRLIPLYLVRRRTVNVRERTNVGRENRRTVPKIGGENEVRKNVNLQSCRWTKEDEFI